MLKIKFFLLILCNILLTYGEIDYCNKDLLCKTASGPHIKCNNDGSFSKDCPADAKLLKFSNNDKKDIVELHNIKRNEIAAGKMSGFEPAERMAQMKWSTDLENLAELNVKRCEFSHDKCHNTPEFPKSGQNMFTWRGSGSNLLTPGEYIAAAFDAWFNEYKHCDMSYINKYKKHEEGVGHFAVIVSDRNNHVGCAAVMFSEKKDTRVIVTCNYAYTNMLGYPVYVAGKSGSGCKDGTDSKYKALCKLSEKYN